MSPWMIYLWLQADTWGALLTMVAIFSVVVFLAWCVVSLEGEASKPPSWLGILALLTTVLAVTIPSSRTIAAMYVLPKIAESRVIQQDLPDIYDAAMAVIKEQLRSNGGDS